MNGTRLVVSGQDASGKSVIVRDDIVARVELPVAVTPLWAADDIPRFPIDGQGQRFTTMFPPPGGYRLLIMTIPPDAAPGVANPADPADRDRIGTGAALYMEPDHPGMHRTDTVDFEVVLSGEASQEFDDGAVVHLRAGDCFVQNGTRHRWFNRGDIPAVVAVILIGGHPRTAD